MPFTFEAQSIPEVILICARRFDDERGYFLETHKQSEFTAAGITGPFVQDNHSVSAAGVVRGLHFQLPPHAQGKLVRVAVGSAWDVAVDIRRRSSTFGRSVAASLSAEGGEMLWIPPGFAHGFLALEEGTHLLYKCTAEYAGAAERGIRWDDPTLALPWPTHDPTGRPLTYRVSDKDAALPPFDQAELFP